MIRRRALAAGLAALLAVAGCTNSGASSEGDAWHGGRIFVATGNTTGVYYQLGGGYADIITRHLPGYEARAEPTGASGENISRVANGDMQIAFSLADTAADAIQGSGAFNQQPHKVLALARIYSNYTHVIVRKSAKISSMAKLRDKRVSTGSPKSGTDMLAGRLLEAAGLDPESDIRRQRISLPETVKGMRDGTLDAMFFSGGLPTPGIKDLMIGSPGKFEFLAIADLLEPLSAKYGPVYAVGELPKEAYHTTDNVQTIVVPNILLVSPEMPEQLAFDLTRLLFQYQHELTAVHPEGRNFDRRSAAVTDPILLHPGAKRYYEST